jgi:putative hydrolase of the HAD superfamily
VTIPVSSRAEIPRPEVVFLDVGDTLIRAHPSWAAVYRLGLADCGIDVAEKELERVLLEETRSGWWLFEDPFEPTEKESFARIKAFDAAVLARLGHPDLPDDVFRSIEAAFARRSAWHVFPDVMPALEAMKSAGLRLGVISNFVWGGPELLHNLDLARHFEVLVVSARVGFQKPHRSIFEHALNALGVTADRAMHVGDSYKGDVLGARRVGITPVLIDRSSDDPARVRQQHDDPQLTVVRDLFELLDLLGIGRPVPTEATEATTA